MDKELIKKLIIYMIKSHEGFAKKEYYCPSNQKTIGFGHNLTVNPLRLKQPISAELAEQILQKDFDLAYNSLIEFSFFKKIDEFRKCVVASMVFNMGLSAFLKFKKTISYLENCEYEKAAKECLNSLWAKQVGERSKEISKLIETGNPEDVPVKDVANFSKTLNKKHKKEMMEIKKQLNKQLLSSLILNLLDNI